MFQSLLGFRDFYPEDCSVRNAIFAKWRSVARNYCFSEYDAPIVEPLELLTAKSGDEIVGQLFHFQDKGGAAVTLRPELTPSLARMVGARAGGLKRPIKWFNIGENFRYERPQKGRLRAFYQFNADVLGEPGISADAEIISLMVDTLRSFGLGPDTFCVRLSDRNLWWLFLASCGIKGQTANAILSILDKFERQSPEKILIQLADLKIDQPEVLMQYMNALKGLSSFTAMRDFFQRETGQSAVGEQLAARLSEWEQLLARLEALGVMPFVRIDLSIVRGLAYYTGFVFEAFQLVGEGRALAGGGRYDQLVGKLSGTDLPAVGFGMGDVTLRDLLQLQNQLPAADTRLDAYAIIMGAEQEPVALRVLFALRRAGYCVDYSMKGGGIAKQFKLADQSGARFGLIFGEDEVAQNCVKLKNLIDGGETQLPLDDVVAGFGRELKQ